MQKKLYNRFLSVLLCFCIIISCNIGLVSLADSSENEGGILNYSFDFEKASDIDYWQADSDESNRLIFEIKDNSKKSGTNISDKVLGLRAAMDPKTNQRVDSVFKLKNSVWDKENKQISRISFDYYPQGSWSASMRCLYWYQDKDNWKGFELLYQKGEYWLVMYSKIDGYCDSQGNSLISVTPKGCTIGLNGYENQFIKVNLDYTAKTVVLRLTSSDGKKSSEYTFEQNHLKTFYKPDDLVNYASEPEFDFTAGEFAFIGGSYQESFVDNFTIDFIDKGSEKSETEKFRNTFSNVLSLDISKLTLESNKNDIENLYSAFMKLPLVVRNADSDLKSTVNALYNRIEDLESMKKLGIDSFPVFYEGYPDTTIDFEKDDDLLLFKPEETSYNARYGSSVEDNIYEIAEDPENPDNNCLKISGKSGRYVLRDFLWPEMGTAKKITYKMRLDMPVRGQGQNYQNFYISYADENNYVYLSIFHNSPEFYTMWLVTVKDGIEGSIKHTRVTFDLSQWFEVACVINSSTLIASVDIMPINQDGETASLSTSLFTQNSKIAIGAPLNNVNLIDTMWIDDLTISFDQGDWDEDISVREPIVYNSGNTVYKPGDAVMIYGEDLYSTVSYVELMRISDNKSADSGYVISSSYINAEQNTSKYSSPKTASDVFELANAANIHRLQIVQAATDSIKFVIPETLEEGIFAVKLAAKYKPAASSGISSYDKIIYLNTPEITQLNGDDGTVATPGGSVRITGRNLVQSINTVDSTVTDSAKIAGMNLRAELKSQSGKKTELTITKVYSPYSVEASIPDSLSKGNYELTYYSGYGDGSCWSMPVSLKISDPIRSKWKTDVFNVCDFGAVSNDDYNDTFAFVNALDAAAKNGGGIVYVPAGIYHLVNMIVIPENVHFMGDGKEVSILYWSPYLWDWGELPEASVLCSSNTEISDLSLYAARSGHMISVTTPDKSGSKITGSDSSYAANVYIHDLKINASPAGNGVTGGGAYGINISGLTMEALEALIYQESGANSRGIQFSKCENAQVTNCEVYVASAAIRPNFQSNSYMADNYLELISSGGYRNHYWIDIEGTDLLFENNTLKNSVILFGNKQFDGVYFANNKMSTDFWNNTELITGDQTWHWGADRDGIIQKDESDISNRTYLLTSQKTDISTNRYKGEYLCIRDGQGSGQVRRIVYSDKKYVVVESPFTVEPNRNSRASIEAGIADVFFTGNDLQYGSGIGSFGIITGTVMSHNKLRNCDWMHLWPYSDSCDWYVTMSDNYLTQGYHHLATGETDGESGYSELGLRGCGKDGSIRGITIKNNKMYEGWFINLESISYSNAVRDVLIDNNYIDGAETAISFTTSNIKNGFDGIMMYRNTFENCKTNLGGNYKACSLVKNSQEFYKVMVLETFNESDDGFIIGDVNMDGKISLKDSTLIRYYLIGKIQLTDQQLKRADVNLSGKVTILDSTLVKMFICGKVAELGKAVSDINMDESSSSEAPSEPSSTPSSSSSSESSDSSASSSTSSSSSSDSSQGSLTSGKYDTSSSSSESGEWVGPY